MSENSTVTRVFPPASMHYEYEANLAVVELELTGVGDDGATAIQARMVHDPDAEEADHVPITDSSELESELLELLGTRPSLAAGRSFRGRSAPLRRARSAYHSVPHSERVRPRTSGTTGRMAQQRSNSVPDLTSAEPTDKTLEDIAEEEGEGIFTKELRQSTRRLRQRIEEHRQQSLLRPQAADLSRWAYFKDVKWPKIKSRLQLLTSFELWKGHMKEVEGHFGTAVVSYFVYLRWVFIMNLIVFAFWFGFVVVPQIVWEHSSNSTHTTSQLSCVYEEPLNGSRGCPLGEPQTVWSQSGDTFEVRLCVFETNEMGVLVADRESSQDGVHVAFDNCTNVGNETCTEYRMCVGDIDPYVEWYEYLLDFFLGQGVFNETVLFHGWYTNTDITTHDDYNMPIVFLLLVFFVYAVSIVLLVYKMGHAYNESYVEFGSKKQTNFCNKVFSAWDFNITDAKTAKLKRAHIQTDFEEELADHIKRNSVLDRKEWAKVIAVRVLTNGFTLFVLMASGVGIFYTAQYSIDARISNSFSPEGLVLPVVITVFNIVLPFLFSFLARFEYFKTRGGEITMTLIRTIFVKLSSLVILIITLFILIECTQTSSDEQAQDESVDECDFDPFDLIRSDNQTLNVTSDDDDCVECWETFFGQEFYKLGLTNFVVSSLSTIAVETTQNVVSRIKLKGLGSKIGKGTFNIPKSILDLIYTQCLLWLGFMFCPLLPAIILVTTFFVFYVKKYSLMLNLVPDKRGTFRAARTNFLFLLLMLVSLFATTIPVGFTIARVHPSAECGPFRQRQHMFSAIAEVVDDIKSCELQQVFDYVGSLGFSIPIIVILLLIVYAQYITLRSRKERFELIKKQLVLEGANVTHIVGKLDKVLRKLAKQRQLKEAPIPEQCNLPERIQRFRRESYQDSI